MCFLHVIRFEENELWSPMVNYSYRLPMQHIHLAFFHYKFSNNNNFISFIREIDKEANEYNSEIERILLLTSIYMCVALLNIADATLSDMKIFFVDKNSVDFVKSQLIKQVLAINEIRNKESAFVNKKLIMIMSSSAKKFELFCGFCFIELPTVRWHLRVSFFHNKNIVSIVDGKNTHSWIGNNRSEF